MTGFQKYGYIFCLCAGLSAAAKADDELGGLCSQDVEGSYLGTANGANVRINIICIDANRMVATVAYLVSDGRNAGWTVEVNLSHSFLEDGVLVLSDFPPGNEDRKGHSSKGLISYLKLDVAALRGQQVHGKFMHGTMASPETIDAKRVQSFPKPASVIRGLLTRTAADGTFSVAQSFKGPSTLVFDVIGDTPVVSFHSMNVGDSIHLLDGAKWDGGGAFSLVTPEGNGGEPDDKPMFNIRGHFISDREIEFYIVTPNSGLQGPMHAVR